MADSENTKTIYVSQITTAILWTAFCTAMIVIGSIHVRDCPRETNIPIFLIVAGVVHFVTLCLLPLWKIAVKVAFALQMIVGLFYACWFIAGSVWVFRIYPEEPRLCDDQVYKFAFGILIFEYIVLGLTFLGSVLCACCTSLRITRDNSQTNLFSG